MLAPLQYRDNHCKRELVSSVYSLLVTPSRWIEHRFLADEIGQHSQVAGRLRLVPMIRMLQCYIPVKFLDQELISYRYSSCSSSSSYWGDRLSNPKSDRDEIWQDCSSSKCAPTDGVGFSI